MEQYEITMPTALGLPGALHLISEIQNLPVANTYLFDFSALDHVEPFGMLLAARELARCRSERHSSRFRARNHKSHTYAAHMGFFQGFGLPYGNEPGEALGNSRYLPITRLAVADLHNAAAKQLYEIGEATEERCQRLAVVLAREQEGNLVDAVTYSLREIFRNIIDHSGADTIEYCAQYWPRRSLVELAVLDAGCGIARSLSRNPPYAQPVERKIARKVRAFF